MTYTTLQTMLRAGIVAALLGFSYGCTVSQAVVRASASILDGGVDAMNREGDLEIAKAAIPANLKLLEGMILEDPGNAQLRLYAAQALYGYAFGFVERDNPARASRLYERGLAHSRKALEKRGITADIEQLHPDELRKLVANLDRGAVPALFWTASCWAKSIDMNRDDPTRISNLANAAVLMERVLELDETYYYGGPHIFFGVYFGSRPPMLGGDYQRSDQHFRKAHDVTAGKFLLVDVMYAEFLARQKLDQEGFHNTLSSVIDTSPDVFPEMALTNAMARERARFLLDHEEEWF